MDGRLTAALFDIYAYRNTKTNGVSVRRGESAFRQTIMEFLDQDYYRRWIGSGPVVWPAWPTT